MNVSVFDSWLPVLDATEVDMSAPIITVTVPLAAGVRIKLNVVPLPETLPTVALVAVTCEPSNPDTGSENVAVTGIDELLVVVALVDDSTTVGPPDAADESDARPPSTVSAVHTATAETERRRRPLIDFDFIFLLK